MPYRIILDEKEVGQRTGVAVISDKGALIVWTAYEKLFGKNGQSMKRREERGGICWLSEIDEFKKRGALELNFDYTKYIVNEEEKTID